MRGSKSGQDSMLALVTLNELVPARHPVRIVKKLADECLRQGLFATIAGAAYKLLRMARLIPAT